MKYKLEKLSIKPGKSSSVFPGHKVTGTISAFRELTSDPENDPIKEDIEINDIKVGGMLFIMNTPLDFIKTSEITDVLEVDDKSIKFETGSSIYLLGIINE